MAKKALKLDDDVRDVLTRSAVEGTTLRLPEQLDRALYTKTNKALEALGGRWDRKQKGHVFDGDPRAAIAAASETGTVAHPNPHDFFPTPPDIAEHACRRLAAEKHHRILEPSVGEGDLIAPLFDWLGPLRAGDLVVYEKDSRRYPALAKKGLTAERGILVPLDFLEASAPSVLFDRIVMNPPFHRGADTAHISHALDFLAPGGRLVAIVSGAFNSRSTKANAAVLDRLNALGATFEDLPAGSFKAAGTSVATKLLIVDRPR